MKPNSPVSVGLKHYGVIDEDGLLYMAGSNLQGQLGFISDQENVTTPVLVQVGPIGTKIISISCSFNSTIVVTDDGQVYGTGWVDLDLSGKKIRHRYICKTYRARKRMNTKTFQKMKIPERVRKVSHSNNHYLFLLRNGTVRMSGVFEMASNEPPRFNFIEYEDVHISMIIDIKAIDISVIGGTVFRTGNDGRLIGYPIARYVIIDIGRNLHYWGNSPEITEPNEYVFDLDDFMFIGPTPIQMSINYNGIVIEDTLAGKVTIQPIQIFLPEPVKQVALGMDHMLILSSLGNIYVMGENYDGQLGISNRVTGLTTILTPYKLTLPEKISSVVAHRSTSAAITEKGQVYIWGYNNGIIQDLE